MCAVEQSLAPRNSEYWSAAERKKRFKPILGLERQYSDEVVGDTPSQRARRRARPMGPRKVRNIQRDNATNAGRYLEPPKGGGGSAAAKGRQTARRGREARESVSRAVETERRKALARFGRRLSERASDDPARRGSEPTHNKAHAPPPPPLHVNTTEQSRLVRGMGSLGLGGLPCIEADLVQSRSAFEHIGEMERPADLSEVQEMMRRWQQRQPGIGAGAASPPTSSGPSPPNTESASAGPSVLLFPESRMRPLRTSCALPHRWAHKGPTSALHSSARPGEFFVWHVGVHAVARNLSVVNCSMISAKWQLVSRSDGSPPPPPLELRCINLRGVSHTGSPLRLKPDVQKGCVRDLWFGLQLPLSLATFEGGAAPPQEAVDNPASLPQESKGYPVDFHAPTRAQRRSGVGLQIEIGLDIVEVATAPTPFAPAKAAAYRRLTSRLNLTIGGNPVASSGDGQLWRLSRLRWLDSVLGHAADEPPPAPFIPVEAAIKNNFLALVARMGRARIGPAGLPEQLYAGPQHRTPLLSSAISVETIVATRARKRANAVAFAVQDTAQRRDRERKAAANHRPAHLIPVQWRVLHPLELIKQPNGKRSSARRADWRAAMETVDGSVRMVVRGSFMCAAPLCIWISSLPSDMTWSTRAPSCLRQV